MATAHRADGWQQSAGRPDRSSAAPRPPRPERMRSDRIPSDRMSADRASSDRMAERMRAERMGPDRMAERMRAERPGSDRMSPDRMGRDRMSRDRIGPERPSRPVRSGAPQSRGATAGRNAGYPRVSQGGRPLDGRGARDPRDRDPRDRDARARDSREIRDPRRGEARERPAERRPAARPSEGGRTRQAAPVEAGNGRLRGVVAVIGIFLITLAGAGADSFVGIGLDMITLVCLVVSTVFGTLLVRRRDLMSVVVAPPLVFVAVAAVNIGLAPSAHFTLPTVATLLVRGFPTMAIATGAAIVLALFRLIARR